MTTPSTPPTAGQATLGALAWLVLAAVPFWWSFDETEQGNRLVLWALALTATGFAAWRAVVAVRALPSRN